MPSAASSNLRFQPAADNSLCTFIVSKLFLDIVHGFSWELWMEDRSTYSQPLMQEEDKWLTLCSGLFSSQESASIHFTGAWVGPRASVWRNISTLLLPRIEQPISQTSYHLSDMVLMYEDRTESMSNNFFRHHNLLIIKSKVHYHNLQTICSAAS